MLGKLGGKPLATAQPEVGADGCGHVGVGPLPGAWLRDAGNAVIHSFGPAVKTPERPHVVVQVFDGARSFCSNRGLFPPPSKLSGRLCGLAFSARLCGLAWRSPWCQPFASPVVASAGTAFASGAAGLGHRRYCDGMQRSCGRWLGRPRPVTACTSCTTCTARCSAARRIVAVAPLHRRPGGPERAPARASGSASGRKSATA
jgi:hypothetical protein